MRDKGNTYARLRPKPKSPPLGAPSTNPRGPGAKDKAAVWRLAERVRHGASLCA